MSEAGASRIPVLDVHLHRCTTERQFHAFDLLRLGAAFSVLVSHVFMLTGKDGGFLGAGSLGILAVNVFFVISGFLVAKSWTACAGLPQFTRNRLLRIFPGLTAVVALSSFVLGPIMTSLPWGTYFADLRTYRYLLSAALDNQRGLPGVFDDNAHPGLLNGSLWTLSYEFLMYGALAVCGLLSGRYFKWAVLAIYLVAICGCVIHLPLLLVDSRTALLVGHIFDFGSYFFAGALAWCFREYVVLRGSLVLLGLLGLALRARLNFDAVVWNFALPYIVLWLGLRSAPAWTAHFQRNDYSYGLYIWAFPLQQTVVSLIGGGSFALNLLIDTLAAASAAWLSWRLVERPALQLKTRGARLLDRTPDIMVGSP
jgi:peptidoglycan/LPS O-acetylase OafA/YrhL